MTFFENTYAIQYLLRHEFREAHQNEYQYDGILDTLSLPMQS